MTGEPLQITNSDATTHNVNAISTHRQGWSQTLAPGSALIERTFAREEIPRAVKCNIHPWMKFYVAVLRHPYFQVTGNDGSFVLKNVPPRLLHSHRLSDLPSNRHEGFARIRRRMVFMALGSSSRMQVWCGRIVGCQNVFVSNRNEAGKEGRIPSR
jgi:hypothetical protein